MAWPKNLTPGTYDLILDLDVSGYLGVWTHIPNPFPGPENITDPTWVIYVTGPAGPEISITKTAYPSSGAPSTDVNFTISVTNNGQTVLNPVKVVDSLPAGMSYVSSSPLADETSGPIVWNNVGSLASGDTKTLYLIAHIDVGSGILNNTVNATGKPPTGDNVSDDGYAVVTAVQPSIQVTKVASPTSGAPSTDVNFTISVTNNGQTVLNPVKVVDSLPAGMSYVSSSPLADETSGPIVWNNVGSLASGDTKTLYLIAHIDVGSGILNNTVNATGKPPTGDNVSDDGYAVVTAVQPSIQVTKVASPTSGAPSTDVNFTISVTNNGQTVLNPVKVVDSLPAGMSYVSSSPLADETSGPIVWNNVGSLASGDTKTLYLIAHIDVGSGILNNTVNATGKPPTGDNVSDDGYAVVTAVQPSIQVTKVASPSSGAPSTDVNFTISVTNNGQTALNPVKVVDSLPAGMSYVSSSPLADETSGPIVWNNVGSLASGDTKTLYLIAHIDVGSGILNNTVNATGKPPTGDNVSDDGYAVVTAVQPSIQVTKVASPTSGAPSTNVNFSITVTNNGETALDPVKVVDTLPTGMSYVSSSPLADETSGPIVWNNVGSLASGDTKTLYLIAHIDVGSGILNNTVNATGKPPTGDNVSDDGYAVVTAVQPSIQVTKVASPSSGAPSTDVNFTISVTNNGQTVLNPVKVVDSLPAGMSYVSSSPLADETSGPIVWNNVGSLASGDTKTLYLIAHIDVGSGILNNTVNATGKPPTGDNVSDDGYAVVTAVQPSIQVTKTAYPSSGAPSTDVNFTISVTNNGQTALNPVKVVDSLPAGMSYVSSSPLADETSGPIVWNNVGSLASGDTKTLYLIAHIDVGSGILNNTVNATGKPPTGDNVSDDGYAVVTAVQPSIQVTKVASPTSGAPSTNVNFSITVTNNGETALDPVKVVDTLPTGMSYVSSSPLADETSGPIVWNNVGSLASGDTKTLYLIAHIDVGSGILNNTVNATGKPPTGDNVSDDGYAVVTAVQPSIQVTKVASPSSGAPSTDVNFTISVTNNGQTALDPVKVVDSLPLGMSYVSSSPLADETSGPIVWNNVGSLASGDTKTLYLIAHIDVGSGILNNTVNATGKPPTGDNVSDDGYAVVTAVQPSIQVTKVASPTSGAPSTDVNFTISVTNNGQTALDPVKVVDSLPLGMSYVSSSPLADETSGPIVWNNVGSLASGDTKTLYLIAHVDAGASGMLNNTANVTGKPPAGDNVTDEVYEVVTALVPGIQVTKTASPTAGAPSTNVNFSIVVTNTGDCTLNPVKVVDTLPADMSFVSALPPASSQVGSKLTWDNVGPILAGNTKTIYLVAHVDAGATGMLNNTANVTGKPPTGDNVTDEVYEVVTALVPGIQVTKTASPTAGAPSTNVNFSIVVTNTGDCTLNPVKLVDTLPADMSFVSASPPASSQVGSKLTWDNVGPISAGNTKTIYLVAHVDAGATGMLNNTANVTGTPPAGDNVTDEVYEVVTALVPGIQVTKTASPTAGAPSTNVNFSIVVTNTGDCTLNPVKLVDTLPADMSFVSASPPASSQVGSKLTWDNVGPILAGNTKTIYLVAHVDAGATGMLNNTANVTGTPPAGDNVTDEVYEVVTALVPGIQVTKTASPTAGAPSTNVNFSIVVTNTGDCTLNPVKLVDTLPADMSFVSASPPASSQVGSKLTWDNVGPISAGNTKTIYLVAHVDAGATGMLNNTANVTGTPPAGDNVSDEVYEEVTALEPVIQVTKLASPSAGAPSTNVNFTIVVSNTGDCSLNPVTVVDTLPTWMSYVSDDSGGIESPTGTITWTNIGPISASDSKTIYLIAHIDAGASGKENNKVNVTGTPPEGDNVSDEVYEEVTALEPVIQVTKLASPSAGAPSTNVNFTIVVSNTGDCTLNPVTVVDTLPTWMSYVSDDSGGIESPTGTITWTNIGPISASDSKTIYLIAHIDAGASGKENNKVDVTGTPPEGDNVSDEVYEEVTALEPVIQVTKLASPSAGAPSTNVNFTIVVSNTGDCTLNPVTVVDTLPTWMSYVSDDSGGIESPTGTITWTNIGPISASNSKTIYLIAHIDAGASGKENNKVNVTGTPPEGDNVSDEVYEEVTALEPVIQVTKLASPSAGAPSTNVNFTIVVSNTGDCTLNPVTVVDTLPTWMSYVSDDSGGIESPTGTITWTNIGPISASNSKTIYLIAHIDAGASGKENNKVNVTGTPPEGDNVSDEVYEEVTALEPVIQVTKLASPSAGAPSTNVNFTIVVSNTGDCTLNPVTVVDTLPTWMSYVSDDSGGIESPTGTITWTNVGPLDSLADTTITMVAHIDTGASGTLTDTVTATGTPPAGDNVSDSDTADVEVLAEAGINVTKTASPTSGTPCTNVAFTITVTNTGNSTLDPVKVVDTLPRGMSYVSDDSGGIESPTGTITWAYVGPLNSLADTTITMVAHIDTGASGTLTDTVTATGTPPAGDNVSDSDTADVEVLAEAGINVTKTASPTSGTPCTNVTFTITITNTGNCTLDPVKVVDTLPRGMSYVSDDSGGIESPTGTITWAYVGPLNSLAETTITLVAHIDTGASGTLTDTVTATGTPPAGDNVTDSDTAVVQAMNPRINITKTAYPPAVGPGMDVTFIINATNTGDCTLNSVQINESLPVGMSFVSSIPVPDTIIGGTLIWNDITGGVGLAPGATSTITMIVHIAEDAEGILRNVVVVNTTPPSPPKNDTENVTVADVEVNKSGTPSIVAPGGNVTYTITYINTGNATLTNVVIIEHYPAGVTFISASPAPDPGTNNVWTIGTLAVGASGEINITVKVPESIDLTFAESGSVIGEGFVMISKELSTEQMPYIFTNVVTLSCTELGPVSDTATTTVSGVPGTSMSITEHGSGIYESDEIINLCTRNRSISIVKTTNAVYKPTTFSFSKSFVVNFTPKWKQDIETKNCVVDNVIRKLITDATYIDDETRSKADNTSTTMEFDSSFNGSLYIGARIKDTAISETYIGEFDVLQQIQIGKGPIPSPSPTPTPTWLP